MVLAAQARPRGGPSQSCGYGDGCGLTRGECWRAGGVDGQRWASTCPGLFAFAACLRRRTAAGRGVRGVSQPLFSVKRLLTRFHNECATFLLFNLFAKDFHK
jgi:hypothetical protein